MVELGPTLPVSREIFKTKYAGDNESFEQAMSRVARALSDSSEHEAAFFDILAHQRFIPAGRILAGAGSPRKVTMFNCFVMDTVPDDFDGIMRVAHEAGKTMRMGGGVGYSFSQLRPRGDLIKSLDSRASGPVSFMGIFDSVCKTIASAGHRRGAQMGALDVSHPSIEEFIHAKNDNTSLTGFNISVGISDKFMRAVEANSSFDLEFNGKVYKTVDARNLWDQIMQSTWDYAEPGVLFLDRINEMNNLNQIERIVTVNPCQEQGLPPYGACLLGSFNLTKYISFLDSGVPMFKLSQLIADIPHVVRAMDNVVDRSIYPLPQQEQEAKSKRRMGLGVTGLANAIEVFDLPYGCPKFIQQTEHILNIIKNYTYEASTMLAKEKGSFPLFNKDQYLNGKFIMSLSPHVRNLIAQHGIRNSHLTSIAPTGTISLTADNVSSGIEPTFSVRYERTVQTFEGPKIEVVEDYGYHNWGYEPKTADMCSIDDHLNVLLAAQKHVDSAISKTVNVGDHVTFEEFKEVYMKAWKGGGKGVSTFRAAGKRMGILNAVDSEPKACYIDPETGQKVCGE